MVKNKKTKRTYKVSIERIRILYHNACGYKRIFYEILKNYHNFASEELQVSAAVVNGMLSIELYIKFLYANKHANQNYAVFIEGHQAWNLYKELDRKTKGEIRKQIDDKSYRFMRRMDGTSNKGKGFYGDIIEWRYLTKDMKLYKTNFNCMVKIVHALYEISSKICRKPDKNKISLPSFLSIELTEESKDIINNRIYQKEELE